MKFENRRSDESLNQSIQLIRKERRALRENIEKLILDFEAKTDTQVENIFLNTASIEDGREITCTVTIDVKI